MRYFKIFRVISTFSDTEKKEFSDFILSPYLTGSRNYASLLKAIYSLDNDREKINKISNDDFYSKAFNGKKFNSKTLRNRLNEINLLARKYIVQKSLEKDGLINSLLFTRGLKERKLYDEFNKEIQKNNFRFNYKGRKSTNFAEMIFLSVFIHLENLNYEKTFENYRFYSDYLISHFLETFFEIMLELESEKKYNIDINNHIAFEFINNLKTEQFINDLEKRKDSKYLLIILFYYLYRSFADIEDDIIYKKYSDIFYRNLDSFPDNLKQDLFGYMISRYLQKVNSGKAQYLKEIFKIYNLKLKLGLYSELKAVRYPSTAYRDYIVVGLRLKKYKWVENFIKNYSSELPEEIRNDEEIMAYARLYLFKKDFTKALENLKKLKTTNYIYVLDASRIKLRIYYETSEFEEAFLEIDREKHYIKNNAKKIALPVRKYSKEFLDYYSFLLKLRLSPDKKEIDYFLNKIKSNTTLVLREWLIQKVQEMELNT